MNRYHVSPVFALALLMIGCGKSPVHSLSTPFGKPAISAPQKPVKADISVVNRTTTAMRTLFTISVTDAVDREKASRAVKAAFEEIRRVEELMSTFRTESAISAVNAQAGIAPVTVPAELVEIVQEAKGISKRTSGKFNIAVESLSGLWQFRARPPRPPTPAEVTRRLPLLDWRSIIADRERQTIYLAKRGMRIGLGAIAKGYAVDRAGKVLRAHGINDFIVNGGGDDLFSGKNGARFWNVGIRDPRDSSRTFARFEVREDSSVCTSGDSEKFFFEKGKRYHHLIDPSTGYPAQGVVSSTVIAKTALLSDGLATAVFVLGVDKGMKLIEAGPDLEAIIVDDNLRVHLSSGLKGRIQLSAIAGQ